MKQSRRGFMGLLAAFGVAAPNVAKAMVETPPPALAEPDVIEVWDPANGVWPYRSKTVRVWMDIESIRDRNVLLRPVGDDEELIYGVRTSLPSTAWRKL